MKRFTRFFLALALTATCVVGCSASEPAASVGEPPPGEAAASPEADLTYDVVVYGGTSGGVIAAYTARQYGQTVLLVEPGRHLGGMTSGGLGYTDAGIERTITGLARDFYRRVGQIYGEVSRDSIAAELKALDFFTGDAYGGGAGEGWTFEPHMAERVFEAYVDEAGVETFFSRQVTNVRKNGTQIEQITLEYAGEGASPPSLTVAGDVFIDASYEGDLMARSGASYVVGREANATHGEENNGVQYDPAAPHQFPGGVAEGEAPETDGGGGAGPPVDPYVVEGDPESGLLPEITGVGHAPNGTGDDKVQAYNFRMTLCQGEQRVAIPQPDGYDPNRYELLVRDMEAAPPEDLSDLFIISPMPNGKSDWNNRGAFSTDYIGGSWDYPEASYAERDSIWREHRVYQQGLVYFLAHNDAVPQHIRQQMQQWGLCPDEFLDTGGWPHQLYVRESRRLVGEYVMTEHNAFGERVAEDGVAFGSYPMDSHTVQRIVVENEKTGERMVKNEGIVYVFRGEWPLPGDEPYPISYRALTPQREEVTNLLVTFDVSASHIAYGSIRMEPVFMMMSQAAGVAASWAARKDISVQAVDAQALQRELRTNPVPGRPLPQEHADQYRFDPSAGYTAERPSDQR